VKAPERGITVVATGWSTGEEGVVGRHCVLEIETVPVAAVAAVAAMTTVAASASPVIRPETR
jgi:hypothetical protein